MFMQIIGQHRIFSDTNSKPLDVKDIISGCTCIAPKTVTKTDAFPQQLPPDYFVLRCAVQA